jgi:hypothetical protein
MRRQMLIPPWRVHPTHVTSPTGLDQVDFVHLMRHPEQVQPAPRCGWSNPCIWCRKIDESEARGRGRATLCASDARGLAAG